ncbi:MAG: DUF309 domain-containing protein [Verrucomicrobiota bacterium]
MLTHKSPKIAKLIADCDHPEYDSHYIGYFRCFNEQLYYEAHDVLEELWLDQPKNKGHYLFYKGLIQVAGAFVHMRLNYLYPNHHAHGQRLAPAYRLIERSTELLQEFLPVCMDLNVDALCQMTQAYAKTLLEDQFKVNPWHPEKAPQIQLEG